MLASCLKNMKIVAAAVETYYRAMAMTSAGEAAISLNLLF